jgi:hypothetical protein
MASKCFLAKRVPVRVKKTQRGLERAVQRERIPQRLADFCDKNALQHIDLARFLIARTIPFERKAR